ncbi:hypothetical protein Q7P35_011484 [Cladosporium inversicolor]
MKEAPVVVEKRTLGKVSLDTDRRQIRELRNLHQSRRMGLIGGYVLVREIMRHDCEVRPALEAYEALMQPFVQTQQQSTNIMRYLNPRTEWGINMRNKFMRVTTFLMLDYLAMVGAAWLGFTEKKLVMPRYEYPDASI